MGNCSELVWAADVHCHEPYQILSVDSSRMQFANVPFDINIGEDDDDDGGGDHHDRVFDDDDDDYTDDYDNDDDDDHNILLCSTLEYHCIHGGTQSDIY